MYRKMDNGCVVFQGTVKEASAEGCVVEFPDDTALNKATGKYEPVPDLEIAGDFSEYKKNYTIQGEAFLDPRTKAYALIQNMKSSGYYVTSDDNIGVIVGPAYREAVEFEKTAASGRKYTQASLRVSFKTPEKEDSYTNLYLQKTVFAEKDEKNRLTSQRRTADSILYARANVGEKNQIFAIVAAKQKDLSAGKTVPYNVGGKSGMTEPKIPVEIKQKDNNYVGYFDVYDITSVPMEKDYQPAFKDPARFLKDKQRAQLRADALARGKEIVSGKTNTNDNCPVPANLDDEELPFS